jgi:rhodanese-related sulfurtransferase
MLFPGMLAGMNAKLNPAARAIPYLAVLMMLVAIPGCSKSVSDRAITNIAIADASRKMDARADGVLFVDARSASEFAERRIAGAVHLDLRDFDPKAPPAMLQRAREIIVYGNDPGSATAVALTKRLLRAEFKRVFFLRDGLNGWIARSLPTEP